MEALKMESPVDRWNDDRLDELNRRVENGFKSVDQRFVRLEAAMKEGFQAVDRRFEKMDQRFEKMDQRFEKMDQRFEKMDQRFATREEMGEVKAALYALNGRFDRLLHGLTILSLGFAGTVLAAMIGLVATLLL